MIVFFLQHCRDLRHCLIFALSISFTALYTLHSQFLHIHSRISNFFKACLFSNIIVLFLHCHFFQYDFKTLILFLKSILPTYDKYSMAQIKNENYLCFCSVEYFRHNSYALRIFFCLLQDMFSSFCSKFYFTVLKVEVYTILLQFI